MKDLYLCVPCYYQKEEAGTLPPGKISNAVGLVTCQGDHAGFYRKAIVRIEIPEETT